jgi:hypothetical protein
LLRVSYKAEDDKFIERLNFAQAIAYVVLYLVPKYCGQEVYDNRCELLYFAQKVLRLYTKMDNGAILRYDKGLTMVEAIDEIVPRIEQLYPTVAPCLIDDSQKIKIDKIFDIIFPDGVRDIVVFRCERRVLQEYICECNDNDDIRLGVKTSPYVDGNEGFLTNLIKENNDLIIRYPSDTEIQKVGEWKEIKDFKSKCMLSLIMSHEMAHSAMHLHMTKAQRDESCAEQQAAYWSRLLVERRELLYNGGIEDDNFKEACKIWERYIRMLYVSQGKVDAWIDAVCVDHSCLFDRTKIIEYIKDHDDSLI